LAGILEWHGSFLHFFARDTHNQKAFGIVSTNIEESGLLGTDELLLQQRLPEPDELDSGSKSRPSDADLLAIYQASMQLQKLTTPRIMAQKVVDILVTILGQDNSAVLLIDREANLFRPLALNLQKFGSDRDAAEAAYIASHDLHLDNGISGTVAKSGYAIRIGDVGRDERFFPESDDIASQMCVPLLKEGRVFGVITVESPLPNAYSEHDQQVLESIAGQLAIALENAHLKAQVSGNVHRTIDKKRAQLQEELKESKRIIKRLREVENRYRLVVERLPAIIYVAESVGFRRMLYVSPQVEAVMGYSRSEWTTGPKSWQETIHPADRDRVLAILAGSEPSQSDLISIEYRLVNQEGQVGWFRDQSLPIQDDEGRRSLVLGIMFNIDDIKGTEQELLKHQTELTEQIEALKVRNEELNAFSHTVAHNLKNPLAILIGFAKVLEQEYSNSADEILNQGIQVIYDSGLRMEGIIEELLLLAEVRQLEGIKIKTLNMESIVNEIGDRLSNMVSEYQATIVMPSSWPMALGHKAWVQEIWVNYVSNAIKYGGRPPRVELGAVVQPDGMARFWVRDNGPGITMEDQERLFVPFTKLDQIQAQGHGLGLSIVQRIATKLGGDVGVQSELGHGSLFWFTLPMAQKEESPED
jgi:PAS domain S-box-containing protein